ncbi:hypothetical protein T01_3936, partial [Trichinella spiralis]
MSIGTVRGRAAAVRRQHFDYCTAAVDLYTGVVAGVVWQQCATIRPAAGGGDDGPRSTDAGAGQAEKAGVDERGGEQRTEARPSFAAVQFRIEHPGGGENQAQDHFQAEQAHLGQQEPRSTAANTDKHAGDDHHVQQGAADRRRGPLGQGLFRVEPAPANCRLFATSQPKRPDVPLNNTSMVLEVLPIRFQLPVVVVVVVVALSTINKQTNKQIIKTTSGHRTTTNDLLSFNKQQQQQKQQQFVLSTSLFHQCKNKTIFQLLPTTPRGQMKPVCLENLHQSLGSFFSYKNNKSKVQLD